MWQENISYKILRRRLLFYNVNAHKNIERMSITSILYIMGYLCQKICIAKLKATNMFPKNCLFREINGNVKCNKLKY